MFQTQLTSDLKSESPIHIKEKVNKKSSRKKKKRRRKIESVIELIKKDFIHLGSTLCKKKHNIKQQ
jgi:hypothetical protein